MWGKLARIGGLGHLGEMIFISRSYGIFYLISIKKFVISLKKDYFDHVVLGGFKFLSIFKNKQWRKAVMFKSKGVKQGDF